MNDFEIEQQQYQDNQDALRDEWLNTLEPVIDSPNPRERLDSWGDCDSVDHGYYDEEF